MSLAFAGALLVVAQGQVVIVSAPEEDFEIGYSELVSGQDAAALADIDNGSELPASDPARQINQGVALARAGEYDEARISFSAAARNADRFELETATGDWVDSRVLARRGLAMLDEGAFAGYERLAVR